MEHAINAGFTKEQYENFHKKRKDWVDIDEKVAWYIFHDMLSDTMWGKENIEFVKLQAMKGLGAALHTIFKGHPCWQSIISEIGDGYLIEPKYTAEESKKMMKERLGEKYGEHIVLGEGKV